MDVDHPGSRDGPSSSKRSFEDSEMDLDPVEMESPCKKLRKEVSF